MGRGRYARHSVWPWLQHALWRKGIKLLRFHVDVPLLLKSVGHYILCLNQTMQNHANLNPNGQNRFLTEFGLNLAWKQSLKPQLNINFLHQFYL